MLNGLGGVFFCVAVVSTLYEKPSKLFLLNVGTVGNVTMDGACDS